MTQTPEPDESGWSAGTDLTPPPLWLQALALAVLAAWLLFGAGGRY